MHKKDALKRKKLINQIRHHRIMSDGRVLTADGRETLLGNLAPVKHIPMLPWKRVMIFPAAEKAVTVATSGENAWFYRLLEEISNKPHDLIGFTPVKALDASGYEDVGVGTVGIAAQVQKIELLEDDKALVYLKGICRYENLGFLPSEENNFSVNVRWFEDNREADALVRPEFEKCMKIFDKITKTLQKAGFEGYDRNSKIKHYDFTAAQYLSFSLIEAAQNYFSDEEKLEMLRTRSTSHRFKKLTKYSEGLLEETMRRFGNRLTN
ncbi:MAG: LON peptidase substrate-binding domain-containing protein [Pyrinomonadaceae bacterium]